MLKLAPVSYFLSEYAPARYLDLPLEGKELPVYDGKPLQPEQSAERQMYTFYSSFILAEDLEGESLCLYMEPSEYPMQIYINGRLIDKVGYNGSPSYDGSIAYSLTIYIPGELLLFGEEPNRVAVEVYPLNYEQWPFTNFYVAYHKSALDFVFWRTFVGINMVQASCVISVFVSIYLFCLYLMQKQKDKKLLWFALMCMGFFFSYSNLSFSYESANLLILDKFSRSALPLTVTFLTFFVIVYTGILSRNRIVKPIFLSISFFIGIFVTLQNNRVAIKSIFDWAMNLFILPQLIFSIVLLVIYLFKERNAFIILIGYFMVFFTAGHDIYYANTNTTPFAWIVPLGFFSLVIALFTVIALEQSRMFKHSEKQAEEFQTQNLSLRSLVDEISLVSGNLDRSGNSLEQNIESAARVTEEYKEETRNIAAKILDQFNYMEGVIGRVRTRMDIAAKRIPSAISNQTEMVEQITRNVSSIDSQIISSVETVNKTVEVAVNLVNIANSSNLTLERSRVSINQISRYSAFLEDVLKVLEDLTEQTNILSINASIEASRAGLLGKGFSVIAGEVRALAAKSKTNLSNSMTNIKEMAALLSESTVHSDKVAQSLTSIKEETNLSVEMIMQIDHLVQEQKDSSSAILGAVNKLLHETLAIKELSLEEQQENEAIKKTLEELKSSFESIVAQLNRQGEKEKALNSSLEEMTRVMRDNRDNINRLNRSVGSTYQRS